jgi:bifunctional UDP-N-acetylglucosamine pyrophosphorylase/glucosamine-1-phosphate N-acetyltransferase
VASKQLGPVGMVLAAGAGKRMGGGVPKPLRRVGGKPMLYWVLRAMAEASLIQLVVVVGRQGDVIQEALLAEGGLPRLVFATQDEPLGTGHAARCGLEVIPDASEVLVAPADVPLVRPATLQRLLEERRSKNAACALAVVEAADPGGYGRVVMGADDRVEAIIEEADADPATMGLRLVNSSVYAFSVPALRKALAELRPSNRQGEYYLTDVVGILSSRGEAVVAVRADPVEMWGVNTPEQLEEANSLLGALGSREDGKWLA